MGFLTTGERVSAAWMAIRTRCETRLEQTRLKLEGNLGIDETNRLRGRILELRALLAADKDSPEMPNPEI